MLRALVKELLRLEKPTTYDDAHLSIADEFSSTYSTVENSRVASVAVYRREMEEKISIIESLETKEEGLKVAEFGLGSNARIPDQLSKLPISRKIGLYVAADFSGEMLRKQMRS